jgi:hypothetical protein
MAVLVRVMVAGAMLLVMAVEVVMRALGGSRRGRKRQSRDQRGRGDKGFEHDVSF